MYLCFRVGRNGTPADGQPHEPTLAYSLENQNLLNIPPLVNFPGPGVRLLMDSVDRPRSSVDDVMSENEYVSFTTSMRFKTKKLNMVAGSGILIMQVAVYTDAPATNLQLSMHPCQIWC